MTTRRWTLLTLAATALVAGGALFSFPGFTATDHPVQPSQLGTATTSDALLARLDEPGPIDVETINSADWVVPRSGLINLDHPRAHEAGLEDGDEPIQIFFHVLRHPVHGTFIVDTGVERALRDSPETASVRGIAAKAAKADQMKIHLPLGEWLAHQSDPLRGVLLTHLHLDHVLGLPDVAADVPIYAGPGETTPRSLMNGFIRGTMDRALAGKAPLREWHFRPGSGGRFDAVVDVFGDGSLFAISVPGHTPGSTAYLARTPKGPVLLAGDASHTAWGWENGVEPGTFSLDVAKSAESFQRLRQLAAEHPSLDVRLGHQFRAPPALPAAASR